MSEHVTRSQWKNEPLIDPVPIPSPARIWTDDEMTQIRLGLLPVSMDGKWFVFMEDNLLHLHRSWTGHGIYQAQFVQDEAGHRITRAVVTSDGERYRRSSEPTESALLERFITALLLDEEDAAADPRVVFHVSDPGQMSYVSFDGRADLSATTSELHDDTADALAEYFEAVSGKAHPDWNKYRQAMIDEQRLLATITIASAVGWVHS